MKIGLFLMTKKGLSVLDSLIENQKASEIDFVCIGKDRNLDCDFSIDIENICLKNCIPFYFRDTIDLKRLNSNFYIAVSWRWLIELPNLIILHDSILPKYRGFSPLVNMLINGEKDFGVTAIFADHKYDQGDVILQEKITLTYPIKISEVIDSVTNLYRNIVNNLFSVIEKGNDIIAIKQDENEASYSLWLDEDDYFIEWDQSAEKIRRKIDACGAPYKGARCWLNDEIIIIREPLTLDDVKIENRVNGKVIFMEGIFPVVVCGSGLLMIKDAISQNQLRNVLPLNKFRARFR